MITKYLFLASQQFQKQSEKISEGGDEKHVILVTLPYALHADLELCTPKVLKDFLKTLGTF